MIEEKYLMETHWNNYKEDYSDQAILLASHLGVCVSEAESYIDDQDYLVLTDEEADDAVREEIEQLVWAFTPSFLSAHTGVDSSTLKTMQESLCEGANEPFMAMIKDFDYFVDDAVSCDGRGHFLAGYDHEEHEVTYKSIDNTETDYYIYRRN